MGFAYRIGKPDFLSYVVLVLETIKSLPSLVSFVPLVKPRNDTTPDMTNRQTMLKRVLVHGNRYRLAHEMDDF